MVTNCCRFLCYFCRISRQNQRSMFDHLSYLLQNSGIGLGQCHTVCGALFCQTSGMFPLFPNCIFFGFDHKLLFYFCCWFKDLKFNYYLLLFISFLQECVAPLHWMLLRPPASTTMNWPWLCRSRIWRWLVKRGRKTKKKTNKTCESLTCPPSCSFRW